MSARTCAALLTFLPLAFAQAKPMAANQASCSALLERMRPAFPQAGPPTRITASAPETCEFDDLHLRTDSRTGWDAGTVTLRGVPEDLATGEPFDVRLEARNVVFALHSGRAAIDWMTRQQQVPFDVTVEITYDPAAKRLALKELTWRNDTGWASLDGTLEGLSPEELSRLDNAPPATARITGVHAHLESKRFLAAYTVPLVSGQMGGDNTDPDAFVRKAKAEIIGEVVNSFPTMSRDSLGAIIEFVRDYPHPAHPFDLSLQADGGGLGAQDLGLLPGQSGPPVEKLRHIKVEATYTGDFH